jgi:hypothetical protein
MWKWWLDLTAVLVALLGIPWILFMQWKMRKWLREGRKR